ncbi:uncharacterized protein LOC122814354 [Protopterus annectens]|uniref:uncharacterized protein LOC122814354 n=1 Tax=Protopterus annectens TaxID=7888 RepID=UPI001CF9522B|nr:uncharacterized protein LOC122814354 [Protopterus annectens]
MASVSQQTADLLKKRKDRDRPHKAKPSNDTTAKWVIISSEYSEAQPLMPESITSQTSIETISESSPYQIQVNIHYQNDITVLQCVAEGGFPLGELEWHFQNGEPINQNQTVLNSDNTDGTFVISNTLKLEWVVSASVCCSIRHPILKTEKSYCKDIKENREGNHLSNDTIYYVTAIIFVLIIIIACLVYMLLIQRRKRKKSGRIRVQVHIYVTQAVSALNLEKEQKVMRFKSTVQKLLGLGVWYNG